MNWLRWCHNHTIALIHRLYEQERSDSERSLGEWRREIGSKIAFRLLFPTVMFASKIPRRIPRSTHSFTTHSIPSRPLSNAPSNSSKSPTSPGSCTPSPSTPSPSPPDPNAKNSQTKASERDAAALEKFEERFGGRETAQLGVLEDGQPAGVARSVRKNFFRYI